MAIIVAHVHTHVNTQVYTRFAEGVLLSIGVSNFDVPLMKQAVSWATVGPHIVQNFYDPLSMDNMMPLS